MTQVCILAVQKSVKIRYKAFSFTMWYCYIHKKIQSVSRPKRNPKIFETQISENKLNAPADLSNGEGRC